MALGSVLHSRQVFSTAFQFAYPFTVFSVAVLLLWLARESERRYALLGLGVGLGLCLGFLIQPVGVVEGEPLKSSLGIGLALIGFSLFAYLRLPIPVGSAGAVLVGTMFILGDVRNLGAACITAGAVLFGASGMRRKMRLGGLWTGIVVVLIGVVAALVTVQVYSFAASSGVLGDEAKLKYERQHSVSGGLLVAGRPEVVISYTAIASEPLVGRGANPRATFTERSDAINLLLKSGRAVTDNDVERLTGHIINSHSVALSWWVMLGVGGFFVWLAFLALLLVASVLALIGRSSLAILITFAAVQTSWDMFFSPWNARNESLWGIYVAIAVYCIWRFAKSDKRSSAVSVVGIEIEHR
ncbi:hypothetical protein [Gordonia sp. YY1]|uniref:hypothetical protein n=1 Tax=Gordonia sp. YY1 TaxID=396712 RepID=UPI0013314547|nr:hypothetical protein [Gordonia sp. YY1]